MDLQTGVGKLKRVGPKTAELLYGKGLYTAGDLVSYYPYRYEKYVSLCAVSQAEEGKECAVLLTVIGRGSNIRAGGRSICHFKAGDATGDCRLTFFKNHFCNSYCCTEAGCILIYVEIVIEVRNTCPLICNFIV